MTLTGPTPILDAVSRRDTAGLEQLPDGWPALHLAAHFGRGDAVDARLAAKASVRARAENSLGKTALALAEERGHAVIARRLREETI